MELWGLYKIALYIGLFGFLFTPVIKSATKNTLLLSIVLVV